MLTNTNFLFGVGAGVLATWAFHKWVRPIGHGKNGS